MQDSLEILGRFLAGFGRSNIGFDKVCINNTALYENDIGPTKIRWYYRRYRLDLKLQRKKNNARYFVLISKSVEGLQSILLFLTPKPVQANHWN